MKTTCDCAVNLSETATYYDYVTETFGETDLLDASFLLRLGEPCLSFLLCLCFAAAGAEGHRLSLTWS